MAHFLCTTLYKLNIVDSIGVQLCVEGLPCSDIHKYW